VKYYEPDDDGERISSELHKMKTNDCSGPAMTGKQHGQVVYQPSTTKEEDLLLT
jgi:hypothetical protein